MIKGCNKKILNRIDVSQVFLRKIQFKVCKHTVLSHNIFILTDTLHRLRLKRHVQSISILQIFTR